MALNSRASALAFHAMVDLPDPGSAGATVKINLVLARFLAETRLSDARRIFKKGEAA